MTHADLISSASTWLRISRRHPVVLSDVRTVATSEQPDVIAWKNSGFSTVVECKFSRSDFRRDAKKFFRREEEAGMGYERYFYAPAGVIRLPELPSGWGLLEPDARGRVLLVVKSSAFMRRNERAERSLLVNAVRRVTEGWGRRTFGALAHEMVDGDPHPTASRIIRELRTENAKLRRALEAKAPAHAIGCDMDEDCTCGIVAALS
jgi:hypothetical protein